MNLLRILVLLALVAASATLQGCAGLAKDRRDAPWDPRGSATLFDQIPNEDGGANRVCCGHLRECKAYQTPRC